jgi:hypothetical protein
VSIAGIPFEFVLFALTLLGVALFHRHVLAVALTGVAAIERSKVLDVLPRFLPDDWKAASCCS